MTARPLIVLVGVTLACAAPAAVADPGDLDKGFGASGVVSIPNTAMTSSTDLALQDDGKVVVAGSLNHQVAVVRLNLDGSLDTSFAGDGSAAVNVGTNVLGGARSLAIQPDGKILIGGYGGNGASPGGAIVRLNSDGSPDTGFGSGGQGLLPYGGINAVALTRDGGPLLGGWGSESAMTLTQLTPNGFYDPLMGGDGNVFFDPSGGTAGNSSEIEDLAVQRDGKIVAVGQSAARDASGVLNIDTAVVRFNIDGKPDNSFSGNAFALIARTREASRVTLQADGGVLLGIPVLTGANTPTAPNTDATIRRLLPNGDLDADFGIGGRAIFDFTTFDLGPELAVQENGKILGATGAGRDLAVVRLQPGGIPDTTFAGRGRVSIPLTGSATADADGVAVGRDGSIVVAGGKAGLVVVARLKGDPTGLDALGHTDGSGGGSKGGGGGRGGKPARCGGRRATIVGTPGKDRLRGTRRADVIVGLGGNDSISGLGGDDVICAGAGKDKLSGGDGRDRLDGGDGNDKLDGGSGNDSVGGGAGNDSVKGGSGADRLLGGSGKDNLAGGGGRDTLLGGAGRDKLAGGSGADKQKQ